MQVIDLTPYTDGEGKVSPIGLVLGMLKQGFSYPKMLEAQQIVLERLKKGLGRDFILLRNLVLPGSDILVPMVLVGPPGVYVLVPTHLKGVYEASGAEWNVLQGKSFAPAPINLLKRTAGLTRAVQVYLERQAYPVEAIEGVLVAADPGLHIDTSRPIVRVLMADAIESFIRSLNAARPVLKRNDIKIIVNKLQDPKWEPAVEDWSNFDTPSAEEAEAAPAQETAEQPKKASQRASAAKPARRRPAPETRWPLGLNTRQFFLLLGMFLFEIMILFAMMIVVAINSR